MVFKKIMQFDFDIVIKKTNRRKTISIVIKDQKVFVSVPKYASEHDVEMLLKTKINWIKNKLLSEKNLLETNKKSYENGDIFLYLGKKYSLSIAKHHELDIAALKDKLVVKTSNYSNYLILKDEIKSWYISKAIKRIKIIHSYYETLMGVKAKKVIFGEYKSKWGSCNHKYIISYDWRIIMAPIEVVNYIVVHEISHIVHPNHSKNFWLLVENYIKNHKNLRKWLRLNQNKLIL